MSEQPAKEIPRFKRPSIFVQMIKWLIGLAVIGAVVWYFFLRG